MTNEPAPIVRIIEWALAVAFLTALVCAFLLRTPRLPPETPALVWHPRPLASRTFFGSVDVIERNGVREPARQPAVRVRPGEAFTVRGWAVDPATGAPPRSVTGRFDEGVPAAGRFDTARPDVVDVLSDHGALMSGYSIDMTAPVAGRHRLHVVIASRGRPLELGLPIAIDVVAHEP